jgi:hypothetical protein
LLGVLFTLGGSSLMDSCFSVCFDRCDSSSPTTKALAGMIGVIGFSGISVQQ